MSDAGPDRSPPEVAPARPGARGAVDAEEVSVALQICYRLLAARDRTAAELTRALARRAVPAQVGRIALERLRQQGLVDDRAVAERAAAAHHGGRALGHRGIAAELRRRGVGSEDVTAVLGEADVEREVAAARELVARRWAGLARVPPARRTARVVGLLTRRGFTRDVVARVCAALPDGGDGFADPDEASTRRRAGPPRATRAPGWAGRGSGWPPDEPGLSGWGSDWPGDAPVS